MTDTQKSDALTEAHVKQIAHLARIKVDDEQTHSYTQDLNRILHLMDTLADIDTEGFEPMASPHAARQPLRMDEADTDIDREALMQNAPNAAKGLFKVPQVIE